MGLPDSSAVNYKIQLENLLRYVCVHCRLMPWQRCMSKVGLLSVQWSLLLVWQEKMKHNFSLCGPTLHKAFHKTECPPLRLLCHRRGFCTSGYLQGRATWRHEPQSVPEPQKNPKYRNLQACERLSFFGTWEHRKISPWHNPPGFFCWGRSLKVHREMKRHSLVCDRTKGYKTMIKRALWTAGRKENNMRMQLWTLNDIGETGWAGNCHWVLRW